MDILSALGNTLLIARSRRMARLPEIVAFAEKHRMPVLTVEDLVNYRNKKAPPL